ncbi:MAG TPA: methyltransferase domain-containing protein [Vicinamibacterales bacterium]|nr:methyltransferase domain-containing protein [Vicinamibacterales bacterium]
MSPLLRSTAFFAFFGLFLAPTAHAQHTAMPAGMSHEQHMAQMKKDAEMKQHGNLAMGFDQDRTTHHFNLTADGGSIAVEANDPADAAIRDQIRAHLREIAVAFRQGDFQKPFMTHSEVPPGVPAMQRLKAEIAYTFAETARGGIVRIATANVEARAAVHEFLTYQIKEHATDDPVSLQNAPGHTPDHAAQKGAHDAPGAQADHFGRHFDNADEWAKSFDDPARDEWQMPARVIDALELKSGQIVADIGAGTGYFTVRLAKSPAAPRVYAVDIEPSMVEYVRQRAVREGLKNVVAVQAGADGTNLPEPVDIVLVVDTYHHIPNRVAYFTALKTRMKPGSRLAIVDFRKGAPSGPPEEFRFTPNQISAELAQAGFALQTSHDFLPHQMFLVYGGK